MQTISKVLSNYIQEHANSRLRILTSPLPTVLTSPLIEVLDSSADLPNNAVYKPDALVLICNLSVGCLSISSEKSNFGVGGLFTGPQYQPFFLPSCSAVFAMKELQSLICCIFYKPYYCPLPINQANLVSVWTLLYVYPNTVCTAPERSGKCWLPSSFCNSVSLLREATIPVTLRWISLGYAL